MYNGMVRHVPSNAFVKERRAVHLVPACCMSRSLYDSASLHSESTELSRWSNPKRPGVAWLCAMASGQAMVFFVCLEAGTYKEPATLCRSVWADPTIAEKFVGRLAF